MEQWNKLVGLVKEFYIAFGQQEFLEKGMTDERMELRKKLFDEEFKEFFLADGKTDYLFKLEVKNGFDTVLPEAFEEVHRSNMSKLENGKAIFREDGKILKGKNYFRPNLKQFIE